MAIFIKQTKNNKSVEAIDIEGIGKKIKKLAYIYLTHTFFKNIPNLFDI